MVVIQSGICHEGARASRDASRAAGTSAPTVSRLAAPAAPGLAAAGLAPSRMSAGLSFPSAALAPRKQRARPSQIPVASARNGGEGPQYTSPVLDVVGKGGGQPLDPKVRADMEDRLGADFSDVRIHTGDQAARSAAAISAEAYTVGHDVVFRQGSFDPASYEGRHRLAHELVHVQQQRQGSVAGTDSGGVAISDPADSFEQEAEATAARVASGLPVRAPGDLRGYHPGRRLTASRSAQRCGAMPCDCAVDEHGRVLGGSAGAPAPQSVQRAMPVVGRQGGPDAPGPSADDRANDPNFLLCLALCELGIPPSLWRTLVNDILSAVSQEYRDRLGDLRGSQEFESFRAAFTVMSTFNKLKLIIGFLGESRIGPLTIEHPAAQIIRRAVLARLAERGLESATLEVASQIIRKVAVAIELAIAAGCTAYCGATALANALLDFSSAALGAAASFINAASQFGAALGRAITWTILVAQASMDPANWNLLALPTRSQAHMQAIGLAFRLAFTPDSFLASISRPLNSYKIPQVLVELAQDINTTLQARGGFAQLVTFTADFIGGLTPLQFIEILKDYHLLSFVHDPEVLADQQQAQQSATPP